MAGLVSFRSRVQSVAERTWLDQWVTSAAHRGDLTSLPPLIDNSDDWRRMRVLKHAGDDIIKLCDPRNKVRFSNHFLCSFVFDREIEDLTDAKSEGSFP